MSCRICVAAVVLTAWSVARAEPPVVDGLFDEWGPSNLIAGDPQGDAGGSFDLTAVHAANHGTELFVHFDTGTVLNLQAGENDDGTLRLELTFQSGGLLTVDLRNRQAYTDGNPSNFVPWSDLQFVNMPTYAADHFELRVNLEMFGVALEDSVAINFSGSDSLENPALFQLESPEDPPAPRSAARASCTTFRLGNLNTLFGGLLDPARGPAIGRLLQAAAADIYCFQEQNSSSSAIAARLQELDPLNNGADWNVQRSGDTVIASPYPLISVPHPGDVAAAIDLGAGGSVVIFSIHPPCCGYIGSSQDQARILEMEEVIETITDLRGGTLGASLLPYRYAPVIVVGDWNLVGSRTPLDLLTASEGPNLSHWLLPHLAASDVYTWRSLNESPGSFAPGLLDLLTHSSGLLIRRNGYVLHSGELDAAQLEELGLEAGDSTASDHLLLVGDFATLCSGDLNGDGTTNAADIAQLLGSWGTCPLCPADLNGDGQVGADDLAQLLGGWGVCR